MNRIFILTGPIGGGKSTFLGGVVKALQDEGVMIGGFVADKHFTESGDLSYRIRDVQKDRSVPLSSASYVEGWIRIGRFYFNPGAIALWSDLLAGLKSGNTDLVVIDEIGPFELDDLMWAGAITYLLTATDLPMIWVIRYGLVDQVISKWNISKPVIMDIKVISVPLAVKQILSKLAVSH
jgi:nucleoside-triphosphatase THEP1